MAEFLPHTFDAVHYLELHPDLRHMDPDQARAHYDMFGRDEGRVASPLAAREGLLRLAREATSALEIGPFCNPVMTGDNVEYLDVLTAAELRARASELGLDPARCPARIHHVGGLGDVTARFAAIVGAHSIEHQPDLVTHLIEAAAVLEPDGRYYLIVPDKRFCFDHFIAESTIAQVIAAYRERRRRHTLASVIEHHALATHNDPGRHWRGDHGAPLDPDGALRVQAGIDCHDAAGDDYVDVHAWYFTPATFGAIVETLFRLGLSPLRPLAVYDTPRDAQEFCAVLGAG